MHLEEVEWELSETEYISTEVDSWDEMADQVVSTQAVAKQKSGQVIVQLSSNSWLKQKRDRLKPVLETG